MFVVVIINLIMIPHVKWGVYTLSQSSITPYVATEGQGPSEGGEI